MVTPQTNRNPDTNADLGLVAIAAIVVSLAFLALCLLVVGLGLWKAVELLRAL